MTANRRLHREKGEEEGKMPAHVRRMTMTTMTTMTKENYTHEANIQGKQVELQTRKLTLLCKMPKKMSQPNKFQSNFAPLQMCLFVVKRLFM